MIQNMWTKPSDFQYLFLDMNAFFASVEQQENIDLRHKPVVVTPTPTPSGCVITSSYEARKLGIKTGISIKEAKQLCPNLIIRKSDTFLYLRYHNQLINIIKKITPFYKVKSIDELYIKISPSEQNHNQSKKLALLIKNKIKQQIGEHVTCSIGIAPNIFLAKLAADYQKPDGLTIITKNKIRDFLAQHKLRDLCGIGCRMQNQLNRIGIFTPLDFYKKDIQSLKYYFKKLGEYWYLNLHGYHNIKDNLNNQPKSISQSHVLDPVFRNWQMAWPICQKLIFKAASRLRKNHLCANKIALSVNFYGQGSWSKWLHIPKTLDSLMFSQYFKQLWKDIPKTEEFPLKISIVLFKLETSNQTQQQLFDHFKYKNYLSRSIDKINRIHGPNSITPATFIYNSQNAPDRISFGKPNI